MFFSCSSLASLRFLSRSSRRSRSSVCAADGDTTGSVSTAALLAACVLIASTVLSSMEAAGAGAGARR